ncbi:nucleolus and neural progenitor protein [Megalops cyprinoides]|uniref:nucleolus and neural progenitor protein n=1 Tax=Megalops cyprinoides TaxID=118141 RepID=UPI001864DB26|nr:nucleolus and neural progenitor protein [Megalops cyprinoides]
MDPEPWNRINISPPGAISSIRIPFNNSSDKNITCLLKESDKVLKLLHSKTLQTEIRVLYAILYVLNNSLRQHAPFRAIKQVEQCINRLKEMKLDVALKDLKEMCPKKAQRVLGKQTGHCEVPSQPMLEWLCLKVLGACKLMLCLTQRCSQAFLLTGQHLHWGEFVVLNVVLTSMLSRLWVFSKGILRNLVPLYEKMLPFLQEVSQTQPMPFLTDFALPTDLPAFLGPTYTDLGEKEPHWVRASAKVKGMFRPTLLSRLFREAAGRRGASRKHTQMETLGKKTEKVDLGSAVLQRHPGVMDHFCGLDMKAMLKRPYGNTSQVVCGVSSVPEMPKRRSSSKEVAVIGEKNRFLKQVEAVSSFSDMAAHLTQMIGWCKGRRLRRESGRLRLLHLKCQRIKCLESQGFRVSKKLKALRKEISGALFLNGGCRTRRCSSLYAAWRNAYRRTPFSKSRRRTCRRARKGRNNQTLTVEKEGSPERVTGGQDSVTSKNTERNGRSHTLNLTMTNGDDIDDIFASIGF